MGGARVLETLKAGPCDWHGVGVAGDETGRSCCLCAPQWKSVSPLESMKYRKAVRHFSEAPTFELKHGGR